MEIIKCVKWETVVGLQVYTKLSNVDVDCINN